jgi:putative ATPase
MKAWGYGEGYQHAHAQPQARTDMECLPASLSGSIFYEPTDRGMEQRIRERLAHLRANFEPPSTP